jgi:hypothetical protein
MMIPPAAFFAFQRQFVSGLMAGAVKQRVPYGGSRGGPAPVPPPSFTWGFLHRSPRMPHPA